MRHDLLLGELPVPLARLGRDLGRIDPGADVLGDRDFAPIECVPASIWPSSSVSRRSASWRLPRTVWTLGLPGTSHWSIKYTERLAEAGLVPSVGSVGDTYDNALAETINGLYKAEVIHRRGPWRSLEAVEYATLEWVDWFKQPPASGADRPCATG
jgi:hypothetical protein